MQITTNVPALNTQRHLAQSGTGLSQVLSRLSSGLRINSAKDDAAGLAISSRMESLIRGDQQAVRNMNDGVSLLQTAEGAMSNAADVVQRIRELGVQAANGSLSGSDRQALQAEANQLLQSLSTQAQNAEFNGQKIFAQSESSLGGDAARRGIIDGLKMGWLEEAETRITNLLGITADGVDLNIVFEPPAGSGLSNVAGGAAAAVGSTTGTADANGKTLNMFLWIDPEDFKPPNLPDGGGVAMGNGTVYSDRIIAHEMVHAVMGRTMNFAPMDTWFKEGMAEFIHGADERLFADTSGGTSTAVALSYKTNPASGSAVYSGGYLAVRYMHQQIKAAGGEGIKDIMTYLSKNTGSTLDQALTNASHGAFASFNDFDSKFLAAAATPALFTNLGVNLTNADTGALGGADVDGKAPLSSTDVFKDQGTQFNKQVLKGFKQVWAAGTTGIDVQGATGLKETTFQVGNGAGQKITVQFGGMSAKNLGLDDIDLVKLPTLAIAHADEALDYINGERAKAGANLSRLQSAINNVSNTIENNSAARSRIRDTDYAQETANLTRQQILQQAGTAMLAQANSLPQLALSLLRG
ncbi:flagellinolysin [Chitinibacter sp. ZOR0017]|uniref:flagellinolysin n=1 Tax=Chitinibacter sp. ZOR0017 TaxID=1339254 RepID=UPI000646D82E|nr:flagellinolysin [Chitinibacter sp. ZOR0017]